VYGNSRRGNVICIVGKDDFLDWPESGLRRYGEYGTSGALYDVEGVASKKEFTHARSRKTDNGQLYLGPGKQSLDPFNQKAVVNMAGDGYLIAIFLNQLSSSFF